jgi:endonuclease/exonuclease/phosphatase family metal-dependent hydrolase
MSTKRVLVILLTLWLVSCKTDDGGGGNNPTEDQDDKTEYRLTIHVATFNMRREGSEDSSDRLWFNRKEYAKRIILKYDFDVFGTQELEIGQINNLLELLNNNYAYIGAGRDDGVSGGEHTAIFYKKEMFEVLDKGNFWLSETPDQPSWGWNASKPRICSWGKFREKATGIVFFILNTHYDTVGGANRLESSKLILKKLDEIMGDNLVLFTGDLNALPSEASIKLLSSSGKLSDARTTSLLPAVGTEGTAHGYNLDGTTTQRIDYIFISKNMKALEYKVINDDIQLGKFSSDHFPVLIKAGFIK